ncbi:hypothetical protein B0H10DRAFT_1992141 [Mycena sp. CBHHK59/15]|nr:hypothetical protein B0H10DRAFT_1992141 [Mycena sp. CBHHK59/15]
MAWYHAQFSTRRFSPYTPNSITLATLPAAQDPAKNKTPDSLFGPNIGQVSPGPAWTLAGGPKKLAEPDELTTDVVRTWIEKSKQPAQPTTTLQALVNLRRPSLRLTPLADADAPADAPHLLEFQYDADAPQVAVHVHVLLPPGHPDAPAHAPADLARLRVFETTAPGGFGKTLTAADAAVIELARFEHSPTTPAPSAPAPAPATASTTEPAAPTPAPAAPPPRKRFTPFHFRRHSAGTAPEPATAGPALAVVEPDAAENDPDKHDADGVKITIRLVALDAAGRELDSPNEQTVYLLVQRFGDRATADGEDARPWVVRVVKREATIGPHTFHLHEIYGLASASAPAPAPAAASASPTATTYPPQAPPPPDDDAPERECLLCLSAPREVVLLPCRHLVACRPCALNMVEFGAGGAIVAPEEEEAPAPAVASPVPADAPASGETAAAEGTTAEARDVTPAILEAGEAPDPAATPAPAPAAALAAVTPAATTTRRKRKAKGWFCPVCRQPYTSLLRITTAPPPAAPPSALVPPPADSAPSNPAAATPAEEPASSGGLLSGLRPAFLRGRSTRGGAARQGDVESQV